MFDSIPAAFDEIADHYDEVAPQFTETIAARVVEIADLVPGENVLDLGCGTGEVTNRAAKAVAPDGHVTGIDLSPRMLARAWAASQKQGVSHRVTLRPGDASSPPAEAGSFDAVLASLVLYLLPNPDVALKAWHDLLVMGGSVVFSWSVEQDPPWKEVFTAVQKHNGEPGFLAYTGRLPGPGGMQSVLRKCGYQHITIITETVTTVYDSPQQFWDQSRRQGPWISWRNIKEKDLILARKDAFEVLDKMRDGDGKLTRHTKIAYARAYRSPARRDTGTHVL